MTFFEELKRRNVIRVASAYALSGWLVLQVADVVVPALLLPDRVLTVIVGALVIGFPIALVLSWRFELTPDGIMADSEVDHSESVVRRSRRRLDLVIIGALVLAVSFLLVDRFLLSNASASPSEALLPHGEERSRSVAVLPFDNLSPDPENAFFADGIHESVLTQLSAIGNLRVLTHATMMRYRDTELSIDRIADELGAGAILRGSVQRAGDQVRISAQLIDPATGESLWADQFDGRVDESFAVQSTVAIQVAERLDATLTPREVEDLSRPSTEDVEALDFFLRGRQAYAQLGPDDNEEAIRLFKLAILEDSTFAQAWASLGFGYVQRRQRFGYPIEWTDSAEVAGRRAIALDSTLAAGYSAVGGSYFLRGRNAEAKDWFERGLESSSGMQASSAQLALVNLFTGHWAEALRWAKRAFRIEPTSPQVRELLANSYQDLLEFDIAERWLQEALERDPRSPIVRRQQQALEILRGEPAKGHRTFLAWLEDHGEESPYLSTVAATGAHYAREFEEVLEWSARALEQASGGALRDYHDVRVIRAFALSRDGLTSEALELLASAEREYSIPIEAGADSWVFPLYLSAIHLVRGSTEEGLRWLERADRAGFNGWNLLEQDPIYDVVRQQPRYRETIATMRGRLEAQRNAIAAEERAAGERD